MGSIPVIRRDTYHYKWSKHHEPVLHVRSGDKVRFEVNEVTTWQLSKHSKADDLLKLDPSKFYPLSGPVFVEGARPGDALAVTVERVSVDDWGYSAIVPGYGLLEEFDRPFLVIWDLSSSNYAVYRKKLKVKIAPFCGVMGVAPREDGYFDVMPPGIHGGNIDVKHLTAGSRLLLPVWVEGALFSVGDLHAAQGDGEVCFTAIECPGEVVLRFEVIRGLNLRSPMYFCKPKAMSKLGYITTTGIAPDLMEAAKGAVREMVSYLTSNFDLTQEEAYVLCSVAGDLRIHEVVDRPNWVVGLMLPREVLPRGRSR